LIDLGSPTVQVILSLFATGIRHATATAPVQVQIGGVPVDVLYAGPQPQYIGLDQINVRIPQSLRGRGAVTVSVAAGGLTANPVIIAIR
jgi:uncharacterized protein (TIGR03437 family)